MPSAPVRPEDVVLEFPRPQASTAKPKVSTAEEIRKQINQHFISYDEHHAILQSKRTNYNIGMLFLFFLGLGIGVLVKTCR